MVSVQSSEEQYTPKKKSQMNSVKKSNIANGTQKKKYAQTNRLEHPPINLENAKITHLQEDKVIYHFDKNSSKNIGASNRKKMNNHLNTDSKLTSSISQEKKALKSKHK